MENIAKEVNKLAEKYQDYTAENLSKLIQKNH